MGKSKSTTKTNQTQTNAPPSWTAPYLQQTAGLVGNAINQIPTEHYSGDQVATMTPEQLAGIMQAWGSTAGNAGELGQMLQAQTGNLLTSPMNFTTVLPDTSYSLAPRQELDSVIQAAIHPVQQQLMEQILPGITNSALASGAYSNDRATGVLPQTAVRDSMDSMQRIASQLGYEDYQNYENRRLAAYGATTGAAQQNYGLDTARQGLVSQDMLSRMGLLPEFVNSTLHTQASQGDLLRMAAELDTANRQGGIANEVGMDQYNSQSPFLGLDTASQILARLSGNYGTQNMTGTSTTTQSPSLMSTIGQGLQMAAGIAGAAMGMPGGLGALGGGSGLGSMGAAANLFPAMNAMVQPTFGSGSSPLAFNTPTLQQLMATMPGYGG